MKKKIYDSGLLFFLAILLPIFISLCYSKFDVFSSEFLKALSFYIPSLLTGIGIYLPIKNELQKSRVEKADNILREEENKRIQYSPDLIIQFRRIDSITDLREEEKATTIKVIRSYSTTNSKECKKILIEVSITNLGGGYAKEFITTFFTADSNDISWQDTEFYILKASSTIIFPIEILIDNLKMDSNKSFIFGMKYTDRFNNEYSILIDEISASNNNFDENGNQFSNTNLHFPQYYSQQVYEPIPVNNQFNILSNIYLEDIDVYKKKIYYGIFERLNYPEELLNLVIPYIENFVEPYKKERSKGGADTFVFRGESNRMPQYVLYYSFSTIDLSVDISICINYDYSSNSIKKVKTKINCNKPKDIRMWIRYIKLKARIWSVIISLYYS